MRQPTILVLWSYRSDEVTTVTLVSRLRDAGLRVKLIGLDGRSCAGRVGLVLKVDRTLAEWLPTPGLSQNRSQEPLRGIILPFDGATWERCTQDERFLQLLHLAHSEQALFVIRESTQGLLQALLAADAAAPPVRMLPLLDALPEFLDILTQAFC